MFEDHETKESSADTALEAELARFAEEEAQRLGLRRKHYKEKINTDFRKSQRAETTLWVSGLTMSQDLFVAASLSGIGYKVKPLDVPDQTALQLGKEFGNRGQCNPTYFTVGNLVKHLCRLRDEEGIPTADILANNIFLTAGACGPCRFGMYVTEFRKALRDAGFDGFRVLLFQQQGGIKQATGDELGLQVNAAFASALVRAMIVGDVLNLMGYRIRPYEVEPGATDAAISRCRERLIHAFSNQKSIHYALYQCRRDLERVEVDRSRPKPRVSVIGEFWAMTTEGDGNYHLQRFLEKEGAEVDIQPIANWFLFMVWENRFDTLRRMELKEEDGGRKGLKDKNVMQKMLGLAAADKAIRAIFHSYAAAIGLHGYHLADMDQIARLAAPHHDLQVRGGEAHMEVGKLVHFVEDHVNHLTISVKPFGCMPSSGVSDGVQAAVTTKYPEALFLPIETTGDGAVNVQSRIQMMLFKARQKAKTELETILQERGLEMAEFQSRLQRGRYRSPVSWPPHRVAGTAANLAAAV